MAYVNEESIHAGISFIHNFAEWLWTMLTFQEGAGYETIHNSDVGWLHQINLWSTVIPMTFGKVSLASRVSARLSQPPVTETPAKVMCTCDRIDFVMLRQHRHAAVHGQRTDFRHGKCMDSLSTVISSPTGVSAVRPTLWIALVNTCLAPAAISTCT